MDKFQSAYEDAIASVRGIKNQRNVAIAEEQRKNFKRKNSMPFQQRPKRPKPSTWTQKFYCLSCTESDKVSTKPSCQEILTLVGLGEKKVQIPDVDCSTEEFHAVILQSFPKLKDCGGFELLRCVPSTRDLEIIQSPMCHSPRLLRSRFGNGRIYIRPIQIYIDTELDSDSINEVSEFI